MATDWFRTPHWDPTAQADFEQRLSRSRPYNRPQYLRVKALALRDAGDPASARQLLMRVLETSDLYDFEAAIATEILGDIAWSQGGSEEAESRYRAILHKWPSLNGTTGAVEVSLAEVLSRRKQPEAREEARELLSSYLGRPGLKLDDIMFRCTRRLSGPPNNAEIAKLYDAAPKSLLTWRDMDHSSPDTATSGSSTRTRRLCDGFAVWPGSASDQPQESASSTR